MERCADPLLQLEIDEWILDYLIFSAIKALLEDYKGTKDAPADASDKQERASVCLQLVDSFFTTFCTIHPEHHASLDLRFRLRLLKFTAMSTKRSAPAEATLPEPALKNLRHRRQEQAVSFRSGDNDFAALDLPDLTEFLAPLNVMEIKKEHIGHESTGGNIMMSDPHGLFPPAISLLDTIPFFMAVSAAQISMQEGTITDTWMRLAAGYMAQAVAEQYLVYGSQRQEVLQEAFAWGFDPECSAEDGTDDFQINAMFWGVDAVVDGWDRIRDEHAQALIPPAGTDLQLHLETVMANDLSIAEFERRLIDFLDKMLMGQSKPFLLQMESGKVDGLPRKKIKDLFEAIGMI